mmetsp:Transcript_9241/g.10716  ORF Transcript_9241/g.10716 Transcript_9241/m.10716 type:complete len:87 (-) Transcript_9241:377-637(-)
MGVESLSNDRDIVYTRREIPMNMDFYIYDQPNFNGEGQTGDGQGKSLSSANDNVRDAVPIVPRGYDRVRQAESDTSGTISMKGSKK